MGNIFLVVCNKNSNRIRRVGVRGTCVNCSLQIDRIDYNLPNALQQTSQYTQRLFLSRRCVYPTRRSNETDDAASLLSVEFRFSIRITVRCELPCLRAIPFLAVITLYYSALSARALLIDRSIDRSIGKICESGSRERIS